MNKNIEILEKEINELGPTWNLFGKVDRMKFLLKKIKEELKSDFEFEAETESVGFTMLNNHGKLKLTIPYRYDLIQKLDREKKLKVSIMYKS